MAQLNYRTALCVDRVFELGYNTYTDLNLSYSTFDDNNVFTNFIKCDMGKEEDEIPTSIIGYVMPHIISTFGSAKSQLNHKEIVIPLVKTREESKRTFDSIYKYIYSYNICGGMANVLSGIHNYYGVNGLILDSNYNPLFMTTVKGVYLTDSSNNITRFLIKNFIIYIHPNVIINESDIINKGIMKKIIPYILNNKESLAYYIRCSSYFTWDTDFKLSIVIEDANRFFTRPTLVNQFSNEDINNTIVEQYQDDILNSFQ